MKKATKNKHPETQHVDFLLLGGGLASVTAAETLRLEDALGTILIIAAEKELPYTRDSLSKKFLMGKQRKEHLTIFSQQHLDRQKISLLSGVRATAVEPENRIVHTDTAGSFSYGKLLIATGSRPKKIDVPGDALPGIHYLRTIEDAQALKIDTERAQQVVVVGGGYVGVELASTFTQMGLNVTLVVREKMLLALLRIPQVYDFFHSYFEKSGVKILSEEEVVEFYGQKRVEGVRTRSGQELPCDFAVIGIGIEPEIDFLANSGIRTEYGILVNQFLQTNQPHIYAAGDVASSYVRLFHKNECFNHWDSAFMQGRLAAKNMLGMRQVYRTCPYFFSDVFDLTFEFLGNPNEADEWIERGSLAEKSYALFFLKENIVQGLFSVGRPAEETQKIESLIQNKVNLSTFKEQLADPDFSLTLIPAEIVLILPGGGALGAFQCGAVKALEEHHLHPDIVAGVSIGAINGAIIASNPTRATAALEAFWDELSLDFPSMFDNEISRQFSSALTLMFGNPVFFRPRWLMSPLNLSHPDMAMTSFYDSTPMRELLCKHVDFSSLKSSPVRLLVSAVNVETAELETFDSYREEITAEHIMASSSLPPSFPWTKIDGKYYWDGGIVSNSPLNEVIQLCGSTGKHVFILDLFSKQSSLPQHLLEVLVRRDEIVFTERTRMDGRTPELVRDYRRLVEELIQAVDPETAQQFKQQPNYIQLMGDLTPMKITRIGLEDDSPMDRAKSHDFSRKTIQSRIWKGYQAMIEKLGKAGG